MRERRRRYGNLTAIVLAVGLTFGAPDPSRAQEAGDASTPSAVEEQYREGVAAFAEENYELAFRLLKPYADKENAEALTFLGFIYQRGLGGAPLDPTKAYTLFEMASDLGNEHATLQIAGAYEFGNGVEQDIHKAQMLYKELAECGMLVGHILFGNSFLNDKSAIPAELYEAERSLRTGAESGIPYAQTSLGVLLFEKLNKIAEGWRWIAIAAKNNNKDAAELLKDFQKNPVYSGYIENAILYAEQWQGPKPPPVDSLYKCSEG